MRPHPVNPLKTLLATCALSCLAAASACAACTATHATRDAWPNGFVVDVTLTNTGDVPVRDWKVQWSYDKSVAPVSGAWGGRVAVNGRQVSVAADAAHPAIDAGATRTAGLVLTFEGTPPTAGSLQVIGLGCAPRISPTLVANNLWWANAATGETPGEHVLASVREAGTRLVRIGGHEFDVAMPTPRTMADWVLKIRGLGAEPIVQVSQYDRATPMKDRVAAAVEMVRYLNVERALGVRYWSIGNEPWLQEGAPADHGPIAPLVATYVKAISPAMKAVDPGIRIFAPDEAYFMEDVFDRLFAQPGAATDIGGRIPGRALFYVDGMSWHTYPQKVSDPATDGAASIEDQMVRSRRLVDAANARQGRSGADSLAWGVGEFNAATAAQVHSFENGQMFGQAYGVAMKQGAEFLATWSMFEHSGDRTGSDFSLIDGDGRPRASFHHMAFVGHHMRGQFAEGISTDPHVVAYGARDGDTVSVMLMNRGREPKAVGLRLDGAPVAGGQAQVNVHAAMDRGEVIDLPPRTTLFMVFKGAGVTTSVYGATHFESRVPPSALQR